MIWSGDIDCSLIGPAALAHRGVSWRPTPKVSGSSSATEAGTSTNRTAETARRGLLEVARLAREQRKALADLEIQHSGSDPGRRFDNRASPDQSDREDRTKRPPAILTMYSLVNFIYPFNARGCPKSESDDQDGNSQL